MEPLNLPRGSVRAILTILLVILLGLTMFIPVVPGAQDIRSGLLAATVAAVGHYFNTRQTQNQQDGPPLPPPAG